MDNGLIFPYRRRTVHIKAYETNLLMPLLHLRVGVFGLMVGPECVVDKRVNRCDAGR